MAQLGISATLKGNAVELQMAFKEKGYPVAFIGSDVDKLKIFNVLTELKLARRIGPIPTRGSKEEEEAKAQDKDGLNPHQIKDEATGCVYEVDNRPSVIISITGDAYDLPEDHELEEAVTLLTAFCREKKLNSFVLSREAAHRAILANYVYREEHITENYIDVVEEHKAKLESLKKFKSMLISYLLEIRIQELENRFKVQDEISQLLSECFKYVSVRDVLLNITKKLEDNVDRLFSGDFKFRELELKVATQKKKRFLTQPKSSFDLDSDFYEPEPILSSKRLSKSR
jgi:hypothetical protein